MTIWELEPSIRICAIRSTSVLLRQLFWKRWPELGFALLSANSFGSSSIQQWILWLAVWIQYYSKNFYGYSSFSAEWWWRAGIVCVIVSPNLLHASWQICNADCGWLARDDGTFSSQSHSTIARKRNDSRLKKLRRRNPVSQRWPSSIKSIFVIRADLITHLS